MFSEEKEFKFDSFTLKSLDGNSYPYDIDGKANTLNNQELGLEFKEDDYEVLESTTQKLAEFRNNQTQFVDAVFYLKGEEVLKMPFKYVGGGTGEMYDLLAGLWYLTAKELGIELLNQ